MLILAGTVTPVLGDEVDERSVVSDIDNLRHASRDVRRAAMERLNRLTFGSMLRPTLLGEMSHLSETGHTNHLALRRAFRKKVKTLQAIAGDRDDAPATSALCCLAASGPEVKELVPFLETQFKQPGLHACRRLAIYCALLTNVDEDKSVLEFILSALSALPESEQLDFLRVLQHPKLADFGEIFFEGEPLQSYEFPDESGPIKNILSTLTELNDGYSELELARLILLGRADAELSGLSRLLARDLPSLQKVVAIQMILGKLEIGGERYASHIESLLDDKSRSVALAASYALAGSSANQLSVEQLTARVGKRFSPNEHTVVAEWLNRARVAATPVADDVSVKEKRTAEECKYEIHYLVEAVPASLKFGNRGQKIDSLQAARRLVSDTPLDDEQRRTISDALKRANNVQTDVVLRAEIRSLLDALKLRQTFVCSFRARRRSRPPELKPAPSALAKVLPSPRRGRGVGGVGGEGANGSRLPLKVIPRQQPPRSETVALSAMFQ